MGAFKNATCPPGFGRISTDADCDAARQEWNEDYNGQTLEKHPASLLAKEGSANWNNIGGTEAPGPGSRLIWQLVNADASACLAP